MIWAIYVIYLSHGVSAKAYRKAGGVLGIGSSILSSKFIYIFQSKTLKDEFK